MSTLPIWVKSSLSFANGSCVEVADLPDGCIGVRNSRDPDGLVLRFTPDEWAAFIGGAKAGEFDGLDAGIPMTYTADEIARVGHEANRALQVFYGDAAPSPAWDDAPEWQRKSSAEGVASVLAGETPEQLHESWCQSKLDAGWRYGETKDPEARTHPCLVPYASLPEGQRVKDTVFAAIVQAMGRPS